jgi:uncharacterized protein YqcC (DUF446 family)
MDARLPALAEHLLLIERELRLQGWWAQEPPSAEALASQEPFCVDSMEFEQWLQWIFLPRMKQIIEQELPLPNASGILAMSEMVYASRAEQSLGLNVLLAEFDELITQAR